MKFRARRRYVIGPRESELPAEKKGRDYFIDSNDLKLAKNRKPGRPKKAGKKRARAARTFTS